MTMRNPLGLLLVLLAALGLAGCGHNLPEELRNAAAALEKGLASTETHIQAQQEKFEKALSSSAFAAIAPYAAKEDLVKSFDRAREETTRARTLYTDTITPLIKKDDPASAPQIKAEILRAEQMIQGARASARQPFDRMDRIRYAMTDTRALRSEARAAGRQILVSAETLKTGPVAQALEKFPDSAGLIQARIAPFDQAGEAARRNLTIVEREFKAHDSGGNADYAAFATAADSLVSDAVRLRKEGKILEEDIAQLYQSYTKVLQDMKVDYYLTIKRESWDERSDYYNPAVSSFTRKVSPATYTALTESTQESIADVMPAYGRVSFKNNVGPAWDTLQINPTENWPDRQHNAATFWVEDSREDYFHKYLLETNGETRETDWEKVNPSFFEQHQENLGMAILSKPYGVFEPDAMAAPPGMAYVGNPEYGEWKKDEKGESFWSWYGRYAFFSHLFFFPPSYYYYGSWNRWRTDYRYRQPYYGQTKSGQTTYGTRGTQVKGSPRYQNTTFAKTGGFKGRAPSVRGASVRGGGPGAKGK